MLNVDVHTIYFLVGLIDNAVTQVVTHQPNKHPVQGYESPKYGQPETPTEVETIYF